MMDAFDVDNNFLGEFTLLTAENGGYILSRRRGQGMTTRFYIGRDLEELIRQFVAELAKEKLDKHGQT